MADSSIEPTTSAAARTTTQQKLAAEVIGTFVLVFFGCGSVVFFGEAFNASDGGILPTTVTTVGLTFGVAVMVMVYAFGRISGGHFNPAVSVGAGMGGRMAWNQVGLYVVAQLVGAVLGALFLFLVLHGYDGFDAEGNMGQNSFGDQNPGNYAWWAAFLLELVLTAVFVMVILAVTDERNEHPALAPLAIGLTLAAIHFVAIPATGTSVNPARSIGPALFAGGDAIIQLWLFILAPLIGATIAGLAYAPLFGRAGEPVPGSGMRFSLPRRAVVTGPDQYQQQWNQETDASGYAGYAGQSAGTPIIQDGWQWDPVGQQWHPVGQTPEQWRAQQEAEHQAAQQAHEPTETTGEQWGVPSQHQWPEEDHGDEGTQVRPPGQ